MSDDIEQYTCDSHDRMVDLFNKLIGLRLLVSRLSIIWDKTDSFEEKISVILLLS